jgi:hypothetical protein
MHHTTLAAGLLAALLHTPPVMAEPPVALVARRHCAYLATGYSWDRAIASAIHDAMQAGATISDMPPGDVVGAIQAWCPALNDGAFLSRQGVQ